jgi:FkbM family methyltransferase
MGNLFKYKIIRQLCGIKLFRYLWHKALPYKQRIRILRLFFKYDVKKHRQIYTQTLIDLLEKPEAVDFENKDKVLSFLKANKDGVLSPEFPEIWLQKDAVFGHVFNFNGAVLPCCEGMDFAVSPIFADTFLFSLLFNDNYSAGLVGQLEKLMGEGPYGYTTDEFDVTVKQNDVVIDAGAWIGDFSAYAAAKGAVSYAFEPFSKTFKMLQKTAELNRGGGGVIFPEKKGLGDSENELALFAGGNTEANTTVKSRTENKFLEKIKITTLDKFVHEKNIKRLDFIKADIEGAERDMLKGASGVLKEFAPKLALCTYHLPDDPEVMEALIKKANPDYKVVHISKKLFAAVP